MPPPRDPMQPSTVHTHSTQGPGLFLSCNAFVYMDDILVASTSLNEHHRDLQEVFMHLDAARLHVNRDECGLYHRSLKFLGVTISVDGTRRSTALADKLRA